MKEKILNATAVLVFFSMIVIGVVLVNARLETLEQKIVLMNSQFK